MLVHEILLRAQNIFLQEEQSIYSKHREISQLMCNIPKLTLLIFDSVYLLVFLRL